ncbi:peroxiredoxin-like family protein [Streptomyces parvus]|uniref:peroxiredoxin-like family protein n=1 Tax=Streptomyces parvus TaxID=66428 RepID=UPI0036856194
MTEFEFTVPAPPRPRAKAPELSLPLVGGGDWNLAEQSPRNFTLIAFYRGLHCPACRAQLSDLEGRFQELMDLGVEPVAVSADSRERAEHARQEWGLAKLPVGYDLTVPTMRDWGLFVSESESENEPAQFSEPGLFLVSADQQLYYAAITSMPFGRPSLTELIGGMSFVINRSYPARGNI